MLQTSSKMIAVQTICHHKQDDYKYDRIDVRFDPVSNGLTVFGCDPGTVHLGLARLHLSSGCGYLYQITFKHRLQDPVERMKRIQTTLCEFFPGTYVNGEMIIEGASFSDPYRQTELAEIRTTVALWGLSKQLNVRFIPPTTIRKQVFGNGKTKATEFWPELSKYPDASAALSCALCWFRKV